MRWWKWLGLAGAAGVVATGVVVVRGERKRRAYTPDQVRDQLHARFAEAMAAEREVETVPEQGRFAALRERVRGKFRRGN